jgi:hypothetical protein
MVNVLSCILNYLQFLKISVTLKFCFLLSTQAYAKIQSELNRVNV